MNTTFADDLEYEPTTVTDWVRLACRSNAEKPAVRRGEDVLTYAELEQLIDTIAANLGAQGIGRGDRVGLRLERSIAAAVAPFAVLQAGAAYVPLDPGYPAERLVTMQREADLACLVVDDPTTVDGDAGPKVVAWSQLAEPSTDTATGADGANPADDADSAVPSPEDVAYIIFTSGSTGTPKGIEMPHRALANLIKWQLDRSSFRPGATVLQFSSLSFDVSFQEIATTIASGGCLVVTTDDERRDPRTFLRLLSETKAERIFVPFVVLRNLADAALAPSAPKLALREVITAGEQLRVDEPLRRFFGTLDGARLDNHYGPSETHVITAHLLDEDPQTWSDLPPIGKPVDGCSVHILDDELQPVPHGEVGQLYLGGVHLAHGYFRRPDLTDASFITHTLGETTQRLYASGDLGDIDESGRIHYRGRADDQVKIRGYRVEPAEVDGIAEQLPEVAQSRTVARVKPSGNAFLTSYVVAAEGVEVEATAIRQKMAERLPAHLVPAFVIVVDGFPRTPSGKVHLGGLPDPQSSSSLLAVDYATPAEAQLASIWREVLGFPNVPRDVTFFDLGGDSLEAATMFVRITDEMGPDLPLATLIQAPTIAALAKEIASRQEADTNFRSLQLLNQGPADGPRLFLVHGGAGNVLLFGQIAGELATTHTVYGLQWSGWDGGRGESTVEEMAAAYIAEIRRVQPNGPYRLGGHCLGGLVAVEMAHMLIKAGETIDRPLIVSDAPNLSATSHRAQDPSDEAGTTEQYEAMCARLLDAVPSSLRSGNWRGDAPKPAADEPVDAEPWQEPTDLRSRILAFPGVREGARSVRSAVQWSRVQAMLAAKKTIPMGWRLAYSQQTLRPAARNYVPRPYDGDMLYLRTATTRASNMALDGWWDDIHMGFGELCRGNFDAHVVGGGHNDALMTSEAATLVRAALQD